MTTDTRVGVRGPKIDRRRLLRGSAAIAGFLAVRAHSGPTMFAADPPPSGEFFDIHTHLGQTWNTTEPLSAERLLRWMDSQRITQAVVLPLVSPEASSFPLSTEFVLQQTAPFRDRLVPFCAIDPRTSYQGAAKGLADMLRRYRDAGCRGFGEHKPGIPIDDPRNLTLLAGCAEVGLPVLFHLDEQRNTDAPGLPGLERVLTQLPKLVLIGHGPGFWASISGGVQPVDLGGYPRGTVQPGGALDRLMDGHPNLYGDLSAGSGAGALQRDPEFARGFVERRASRLLFGTDFLSPGQEVPQFEVLAALKLPTVVQVQVYRANARRLLGLA